MGEKKERSKMVSSAEPRHEREIKYQTEKKDWYGMMA
jgi:hypothetical protein